MLILTRKVEESIMLGDDIRILVVDIRKGDVRIGIEAPKDMRILRRELYDANQQRKETVDE